MRQINEYKDNHIGIKEEDADQDNDETLHHAHDKIGSITKLVRGFNKPILSNRLHVKNSLLEQTFIRNESGCIFIPLLHHLPLLLPVVASPGVRCWG